MIFLKYNKCTRFQAETEQLINRNIRLEKNKPENERKWKSNHTKVKFINERTGKEEVYNISLAEIICRFSTALETMMKGKISKIDIRDKILQSDNFNIGQEIKSYTYDELIKEITKCLFIGKDNELIQAAKELTKDYLFEDRTKIVELKNALSENITNFIVNGGERKVDFTFLKILECFGNNKFEIFEKRGLKAKATDFARALGGCDNYYWTSDMVNKYILNEYTNSIFVDFKQNGIKYSSKPFCSARPIMYLSNILDIQSNGNGLKKSKDGVFEVEYGYYPQNFAPKEMQNKLEKYFKNGNLQNTKNIYHIYDKSLNDNVFAHNLKEYEYEGKRYVRLDEKYVRQSTLNSWDYISEGAWFEVLPVKWLVNEKFEAMVTDKLIFSGIPFDSNDKTKGKFENTDIKKFMDSFLTKDIEQSTSIALLGPQILCYFLNQKEHQAEHIQINEQERI